MLALLLVPVVLQATAMLVDEGWYHRRRGLPRWERLGHPADTLTTALCYAWLLSTRPASWTLASYIGLAVLSCLFVTKDEPIHARVCTAGEQWIHSVLFLLHPVVFAAFGVIWWTGVGAWAVPVQLLLTLGWMTYQIVYWSFVWKPRAA